MKELGHPQAPRNGRPWLARPWLARLGAASGLAVALACGPTVSLDAAEPLASSSGSAGSSGSSTQGSDSGSSSSGAPTTGEPIDDLPPPPLPGECPPGCEVELPLTWTWEDEGRPPGSLPLERRLSAMVALPDGGWVVADHRDGFPWLTRVEADGSVAWSVLASLSCECEIIDLAAFPSGQLAVLGQGTFDDFYNVLVFGRFDLGTQLYEWRTWDTIYGTEAVPPRVGSVIPVDEIHAAVLLVEAGPFGPASDEEWTEIYYYEHDYVSTYHVVDAQLVSTTSAPRPLGLSLPGGELAVVLPNPNEQSGTVVWLATDGFQTIDVEPISTVPEVLALGPDDELVVAGHLDVSPQQLVLQATGVPRAQEPSWAFSTGIPTTSASAPAVAVSASGSVLVAVRTTAGDPEAPRDPAVEVTRLHQGIPVWTTTVPLAVEASPHPLAIASTDDDGLVLAGIVDGHLHLERREQGCRCE